MIINLTSEYRIITDEFQFIVQNLRITQAGVNTKEENIGKEVWKDIAYYCNINHCLRYVAKHITLVNNDLDIIVNKLNLLDIKIEAIKTQLENTRITDLLKVVETPNYESEEEYE